MLRIIQKVSRFLSQFGTLAGALVLQSVAYTEHDCHRRLKDNFRRPPGPCRRATRSWTNLCERL